MTSARPAFDARLIFGLVAAGVLAFIGFFVLTAYAGDFRSGRDGRAHALSVSAVGFRGLVDLIDHSGGETYLVRSPDDLASEDLLIVTLDRDTDPEALAELLETRGGRATLLILPKWITQPHPLRRAWVTSSDAAPPEMVQALLPEDVKVTVGQVNLRGRSLEGQEYLKGLTFPAPPTTRLVSGDGLIPLLAAPGGGSVLARVARSGSLYILADPDILNNHGLKDRETARNAVRLVDELNATDAESVMFDLTLSGFEQKQNVLRLAFEPPFLALTAAFLVAALLAGLHGAARFGPAPEEGRAIALGKAALVENSAGLIRLAGREHRAGSAYADLVRDAAARDSGAPPGLRGADLDAYLDRIGQAGGRRFTELADAVRYPDDAGELVAAARALFMWKKDITQ